MTISDFTLAAELRELAESVQLEVDAITVDLETIRRKLVNVCENLADVLEEVDR